MVQYCCISDHESVRRCACLYFVQQSHLSVFCFGPANSIKANIRSNNAAIIPANYIEAYVSSNNVKADIRSNNAAIIPANHIYIEANVFSNNASC